ncbi:MAG: NAD(P)-dependent oxidoreductase [Alphaproteobacteria bacterium]|nr:NAD(P)-dependent oxidoreductase [Alphaproteobacteria bacterium]
MAKRRVLITGASGEITRQLLPAFRDRYDLRLLDTRSSAHANDIIDVDVSDPDVEKYREHFRGVDAIVHNVRATEPGVKTSAPRQWLPSRPGSEPVEGYFVERKSVDMAFNVLRLAMEENVRRVVITSSNHAADWYETKLHNGQLDTIGPETYPLSDNFYGWAKATYEHLGFMFATGRLGRVVENVQVRVGAPRPIRAADFTTGFNIDQVSYKRDLGGYISERDMQQLYVKSIEAEDIRNEDGIPFQVFYGVSNNTRGFWSIANARKVIDYTPEDDSEVEFADEIRQHITTNGRTM